MSGRRFSGSPWSAGALTRGSSRQAARLRAAALHGDRVTTVTPLHDTRHSTARLIRLALPREHRSVQRTSRAAEGGPTKLSLHGRVSPCFLTFPSGHEPKPAGRMGTVLHEPARSAQSDLPRLIRSAVHKTADQTVCRFAFWASTRACVVRHMPSCMTSPPRMPLRSTIQMLTRPCDGGRTK